MKAIGRPRIFKDTEIEEFTEKCNNYFNKMDNLNEKREKKGLDPKPYLVTGLALHLGMDTDTLLDYQKKEGFSGIIKIAKSFISLDLQERSIMDHKQTTGCIFNLKCNHKMIETQKHEFSGPDGGAIKNTVEYVDPRDQGEKEDGNND